ncbi:aminopeptidase, partial [Clostridioides difficile]
MGIRDKVITRKSTKKRGSVVLKYDSTHIYGQTKAATERKEETMIIRLDEKVFTMYDELDLGISFWDFARREHRFEATESGFIKSR